MKINVALKDKFGYELFLGDKIELFDWEGNQESLGIATLVWSTDEGRITTSPQLVDDPRDFFTKALPRCVRMSIPRNIKV